LRVATKAASIVRRVRVKIPRGSTRQTEQAPDVHGWRTLVSSENPYRPPATGGGEAPGANLPRRGTSRALRVVRTALWLHLAAVIVTTLVAYCDAYRIYDGVGFYVLNILVLPSLIAWFACPVVVGFGVLVMDGSLKSRVIAVACEGMLWCAQFVALTPLCC